MRGLNCVCGSGRIARPNSLLAEDPPMPPPSAEPRPSLFQNRWLILFFSVLSMVAVANFQYGWTLFVPPLQKHLHAEQAAIQVTFTVFVLLETWLVPFEGWLVDKFGPRLLVMAGGVFAGLGVFAVAIAFDSGRGGDGLARAAQHEAAGARRAPRRDPRSAPSALAASGAKGVTVNAGGRAPLQRAQFRQRCVPFPTVFPFAQPGVSVCVRAEPGRARRAPEGEAQRRLEPVVAGAGAGEDPGGGRPAGVALAFSQLLPRP